MVWSWTGMAFAGRPSPRGGLEELLRKELQTGGFCVYGYDCSFRGAMRSFDILFGAMGLI